MATSTSEPSVIANERPPSRRRGDAVLVVVAIVLGVLLVTLFVVQQARIDDREQALAAARTELAQARSEDVSHRADALAEIHRLRGRIHRLVMGAVEPLTLAERRITQLEDQLLAGTPATLEDGRYFGYVSAATEDGTPRILVDRARFLTGQAALEAAAERGDEVTNAYYLVNDDPTLETLDLSIDASVLIVGPGTDAHATIRVAVPDWLDAVRTGTNLNDYSRIQNGYWITVEDDHVVGLEEQWVP